MLSLNLLPRVACPAVLGCPDKRTLILIVVLNRPTHCLLIVLHDDLCAARRWNLYKGSGRGR